MKKEKTNTFYTNYGKRFFDLLLVTGSILLLWPLIIFMGLLIKLDSQGSVIFKQKRAGKYGRTFYIYKFRTMIKDAEEIKKNYAQFNEADGPVFKIRDDPRFTKIGKFFAKTGIDEVLQIINVLKGEMSFVGPRPLPIAEAKSIDSKIKFKRESVLPGITSPWVISGSHKLSFNKWMILDLNYVKDISFPKDLAVIFSTIKMVVRLIFSSSS